ncbi:MAG TPA: hypothetical protein VF342_04140 [Alphaproteobacteria bacterium]
MRARPTQDDRLPTQEALLLDYAERLDRHRAGRHAVHVHLSKLKPHNRREHHLRIAWNTVEGLVRTHDGQLFPLSNADLVFVCKDATPTELDGVIVKLRYLFSEDPFIQTHDPGEPDRFCTCFDLERHYDAFLLLARQIVEHEQRRRKEPAPPPPPAEVKLKPLEPEQLGRIEQALARADLSNLIRRQAVCAIVPGAPPHPVFSELFVSISDLQRTVAPTTDIASNRWLFQRLTETLDKRMLATLPRLQDSTLSSRFSLNLNVATLLSQEFLAFDEALTSVSRGTVVFELQLVDIFADMGSYLFARDFVRDRGYRLCVDGLSYLTAPLIDRERLGVDFVKIVWSPDLADEAGERRQEDLRNLVRSIGESRVILCRCENEDAIRVGRACGITLFQGRHVDALYAAARKSNPGPAR